MLREHFHICNICMQCIFIISSPLPFFITSHSQRKPSSQWEPLLFHVFCLFSCSFIPLQLIEFNQDGCSSMQGAYFLEHRQKKSATPLQKLELYKIGQYLMVYTCHHNKRQNIFTTTNCMQSNHLSQMTNEVEILVHLLLCHLDIFLYTMYILYVKNLFFYFYSGWSVSLLLTFEFFLLCICRCCLTPTLQIFFHTYLYLLLRWILQTLTFYLYKVLQFQSLSLVDSALDVFDDS